jgi:hypothetical protein
VATNGATLRSWIRWRTRGQRSASRIGTWYITVLFVLIIGSMAGPLVRPVIWPDVPAAAVSRSTAGCVLVLCHAVLFTAMRRVGPLVVSRATVSWLLPAPVDRRSLLLPSYRWAVVGSAMFAAVAALGAVGHLAARPVPPGYATGAALAGALSGVLIASTAVWSQRDERLARWCDRVTAAIVAGTVAMLFDEQVAARSVPTMIGRRGWAILAPPRLIVAIAILGVLAIAATRITIRSLGMLADHRIVDAAHTVGSYLDAANAVEPSYVSELAQRRYWSRRRLTSTPLRSRIGLPILARQDLLVARRKPRQLVLVAAGLVLPVVALRAAEWVGTVAVLLGGFAAASVTTGAVHTDAENPVLLRLLGLSGRQALRARLLVPTVSAGIWYGTALGILSWLDKMPPGPWWALGFTLGPAAGVAAVRRARVGAANNSLPPIDTPIGNVSLGPIIWMLAGLDALVMFGLPGAIWLTMRASLDHLAWSGVAVQGTLSLLGVAGYLLLSSSPTNSRL